MLRDAGAVGSPPPGDSLLGDSLLFWIFGPLAGKSHSCTLARAATAIPPRKTRRSARLNRTQTAARPRQPAGRSGQRLSNPMLLKGKRESSEGKMKKEKCSAVSILRQSRRLYGCWPLKGACSQPVKSKSNCSGTRLAGPWASAKRKQHREGYSRNSQSSTATPAEPEELPIGFDVLSRKSINHHFKIGSGRLQAPLKTQPPNLQIALSSLHLRPHQENLNPAQSFLGIYSALPTEWSL